MTETEADQGGRPKVEGDRVREGSDHRRTEGDQCGSPKRPCSRPKPGWIFGIGSFKRKLQKNRLLMFRRSVRRRARIRPFMYMNCPSTLMSMSSIRRVRESS